MDKCKKCGSKRISRGVPHGDGYAYQIECSDCGYIEPVGYRNQQI